MKRLLLSTTLIFGTLTGVMGSDALPDETAPSAPNVATREDVQSLVTAVTTVQTSLNAVDARTQALETALHRLTPEVATALVTPPTAIAIQTAYMGLGRTPIVFDDVLVSQFKNSILSGATTFEEINRLQQRIIRATNTILDYFDIIISHKKWTIGQLITLQNITIVVASFICNLWVWVNLIRSQTWIYPAVTPMAGGLNVMMINTVANAYAARTQSNSIENLKAEWAVLLSNPKIKFYVSNLMALQFVANGTDISPENIRQTLKREMSIKQSNNNFSDFTL